MSYTISQKNQKNLLTRVSVETGTLGWKSDAVAFSVARSTAPEDLLAIGVFENFAGKEADFSFAMLTGHRMNVGIIRAYVNVAFHPRALDLDRLWMMATDENLISQRSMLAIGATFQFRKRGSAANGSDAIVMLMTRPTAFEPAARASTDETGED
jgi:hypothetical protein